MKRAYAVAAGALALLAALAACGEPRAARGQHAPALVRASAGGAAWLESEDAGVAADELGEGSPAAWPRAGSEGRELPLDEWLAPARGARQRMHGLRGLPLLGARWLAIAAYARLEAQPELPAERRALAAFRRGELLRAGGFDAAATAAFSSVLSALEPGALWARAGLELARLERRAARAGNALALYEQVRSEPRAGAGARARATLELARLEREQGESARASRLLAQLLEHEPAASLRIAAADELALLLLERGDLEGAAGALERCRNLLGEEMHELTQHGALVRARLARMRARELLAAAVDARAHARRAAGRELVPNE